MRGWAGPLGTLVAVAAGVTIGRAGWADVIPNATLLAALLAVYAIVRPRCVDDLLAGILLLGWLTAAVVAEAFAHVWERTHVAVSVAWLVPLLAAGAALPRRGAWRSAAGIWMAVLAASAAVTFSTRQADTGAGLLLRWRS